MVHSVQSEIEELICAQLKTFGQEGELSGTDLQQCLERFKRIKQLSLDLDRTKGGGRAPWAEFN